MNWNQSITSNNGIRREIAEVYLNHNPLFIGALQPHKRMPCSAVNCTKTFEPVCDSNGRTHKNICLFYFYLCKLQKLDGQHVRIVHVGECEKWTLPERVQSVCGSCANESEIIAVCDNMNATHQSICNFNRFNCLQRITKREQRVLIHLGQCRFDSAVFVLTREVCPTKCPREYKPVCDSHQITHPNLCAFQMYNCISRKQQKKDVAFLTRLHECKTELIPDKKTNSRDVSSIEHTVTSLKNQFECPQPRCSQEQSPICDNKGKIHRNECMFAWSRCIAAQNGITLMIMPESDCEHFDCAQNCSNLYQPVCSSDFITYPNRCFFQKAKCFNNNIEVLFNGECRECLPEPCPSVDGNELDSSFVCDHNEQTKLKCEFEMLRCVYQKKYGYNISAAYEGRCCPSEDLCADNVNEVCDSNGQTHKNICVFKAVRCRLLKLNATNLFIVSNGPCENENLQTTSQIIIQSSTQSPKNAIDLWMSKNEQQTMEKCSQQIVCSQRYEPVCGSDWITYPNECTFMLAKCNSSSSLVVAYKGECCTSSCPGHWQPVCDDRHVTHENLCEFGVYRCLMERNGQTNITILNFGACPYDQCVKRCQQMYEPVCASNGETYKNECEFDNFVCVQKRKAIVGKQSIHLDYKGECCNNIKCDSIFSPVCDNEGRTHANRCEFNRSACLTKKLSGKILTIQYDRQCCNQPCSSEFKPVCDGEKTYDNFCKFRVAQCEAEMKGEIVLLAYMGRCCEEETGECSMSGAVCDSEGQTHLNMCQFLRKQCVYNRRRQPQAVSIVHRGECCKMEICTKYDEPLCDSQGTTHLSLCHFRNTKCVYDKMHFNTTLQIDYYGVCCMSSCDDIWDAVCDQHGILYKNKCYFELKRCEAHRRFGTTLLPTACPQLYPINVANNFDKPS